MPINLADCQINNKYNLTWLLLVKIRFPPIYCSLRIRSYCRLIHPSFYYIFFKWILLLLYVPHYGSRVYWYCRHLREVSKRVRRVEARTRSQHAGAGLAGVVKFLNGESRAGGVANLAVCPAGDLHDEVDNFFVVHVGIQGYVMPERNGLAIQFKPDAPVLYLISRISLEPTRQLTSVFLAPNSLKLSFSASKVAHLSFLGGFGSFGAARSSRGDAIAAATKVRERRQFLRVIFLSVVLVQAKV